jgi:hypothetical protein
VRGTSLAQNWLRSICHTKFWQIFQRIAWGLPLYLPAYYNHKHNEFSRMDSRQDTNVANSRFALAKKVVFRFWKLRTPTWLDVRNSHTASRKRLEHRYSSWTAINHCWAIVSRSSWRWLIFWGTRLDTNDKSSLESWPALNVPLRNAWSEFELWKRLASKSQVCLRVRTLQSSELIIPSARKRMVQHRSFSHSSELLYDMR